MAYFGILNIEIDIQAPISMIDDDVRETEREIKSEVDLALKAVVERIEKIIPKGRVFLNYHKGV